MAEPTRTPRRLFNGKTPGRRSILWRSRRVFYLALIVGVVGIGGVWMALNTIKLPSAAPPIETTFICDNDVPAGQCTFDNSMAQLSNAEERVIVRYEDLPPVIVQAVLSGEDRRFFDHNGIDPAGIARAAYQGLKGTSQSKQGGSTITQQYVKNVYLSSERTLTRKLREAVLAVKLEQELDKRDILTRYLNQIYFGRGAYGVEAASRAYFGVGVQNLQLFQAAYLAGLIRSPESADAAKNPDLATRRRNSVLTAMKSEGYITAAEAEAASAVPWISNPVVPGGAAQQVTVLPRAGARSDFGSVRYKEFGSEYWMEWVRQQIRARLGPGAETRGLRVYTTLDPSMQRYAFEAVQKSLDQPDGPSGSLVAVDEEGRIRAMVAGRDFEVSKVNLALGNQGGGSGRQPGSTFKPMALAAFVEKGYSVKSPFRSPPTTQFPGVYSTPGKIWTPKNFDRADLGVLTVEQATWKSSNTVYAAMANQVTPDRVAEMGKRLGIKAPLPANYSLVLGTSDVSVLDMATAYSTLARRGVYREPYAISRIEDRSGQVLFDVTAGRVDKRVLEEDVADTVNSVLVGVIARGTGRGAAIRSLAAGKTGTTQDSKDAWFSGFTCHLTASVWMGFPQPKAMPTFKGVKVSGGSFPATIWKDFMNRATKGDRRCRFPSADAGDQILNESLSSATTSSTSSTVTSSTTSSSTSVVSSSSTSSPTTIRTTTTIRPTTTTERPTTTTVRPTPTTSPPTTVLSPRP